MTSIATQQMTLSEHLEELRRTLIRVLVIIGLGLLFCLLLYKPLFTLLSAPFYHLPEASQADLVVLGPIDGIGIVLRISFWCAFVGTSPAWLYALFLFIAPGLQEKERFVFVPFFLLSLLFFAAGVFFTYFLTLPLANRFFFHFNENLGKNLWSLASYLDYTLFLLLASALAFELAAVFLLLVHYGVIKSSWIKRFRRTIWVVLFVLSALLTPPDVLTQLMLAIPMILFFELIALYAKQKERVKPRR